MHINMIKSYKHILPLLNQLAEHYKSTPFILRITSKAYFLSSDKILNMKERAEKIEL